MNKRRIKTSLFVLIAVGLLTPLIPTASADLSWSDPQGDHEKTIAVGDYRHEHAHTSQEVEWDSGWDWEPAGDAYKFADIRRVALVNETPDHLVFEIDLDSTENSPQDPYLFDRVNYNLYLDFDGRRHLVYLARSMWGTLDSLGVLREVDDAWSSARVFGEMTGEQTEKGWRLTVPKRAFLNAEESMPWPGDALQITRVAVMDTYHDTRRNDFEETHSCEDDTGNMTLCFPKIRDTMDLASDNSLPIMKQPDTYGPLTFPEKNPPTDLWDRGYNSTYVLELPYKNLARERQTFNVSVEGPEPWRIVHPKKINIEEREVGTISVLAIARKPEDGYRYRNIVVSLTSQSDPDQVHSKTFRFDTHRFDVPTPGTKMLFAHVNHDELNWEWFDTREESVRANQEHAIPLSWRYGDDETAEATFHVDLAPVGYQMSDKGIESSLNVTFPTSFEGNLHGFLDRQDEATEWRTVSQVHLGKVTADTGDTKRFHGAIPTSGETFPRGTRLQMRYEFHGDLEPAPNGTRPSDYGMPPSAMHDGRIALALQQQDTWFRFPLLPYDEPFDESWFPDPILMMESDNHNSYSDTVHVDLRVNEVEAYTFNVSNHGFAPADLVWEIEGPGAEWARPVPKRLHVSGGGHEDLVLRYAGSSCFYSYNSTHARLVGRLQDDPQALVVDLRMDIGQPSTGQLPPQCYADDDGASLPAPGAVPVLLLVTAATAVIRWRRAGGGHS